MDSLVWLFFIYSLSGCNLRLWGYISSKIWTCEDRQTLLQIPRPGVLRALVGWMMDMRGFFFREYEGVELGFGELRFLVCFFPAWCTSAISFFPKLMLFFSLLENVVLFWGFFGPNVVNLFFFGLFFWLRYRWDGTKICINLSEDPPACPQPLLPLIVKNPRWCDILFCFPERRLMFDFELRSVLKNFNRLHPGLPLQPWKPLVIV